jgi:glutathione synthase/RimK-type ligase-like ATP-grasp enzyme
MILFCGIPSEPPLALAIKAAENYGIDHVIFNQRDMRFCDLYLEVKDGRAKGVLWAWEREWPLEHFTGVYSRLIDSSQLPENRTRRHIIPEPSPAEKSAFLIEVLTEWMEVAECRVVNKASAMSSNVSKPYQTQLISKTGFLIPPTLITNDPDEVMEFVQLHGRVIYKSISSVRSIVQELSSARIHELRKIRHLPTQFQRYVPGVNVRVHVVGDAVFATEVSSDAIDYRYAGRDGLDVAMRPIALSDETAQRCHTLARCLNLPFAGIDLKRTPENDYYCFEVNPSPAYSYYQEHTQQPIAQALVEYLTGKDSRRAENVEYANYRELGRRAGPDH